MLQYDNFNHKGILIEIGDVPDALTDIRAKTPFRWQKTADDRLVFVCVERKIVEVFDTTGKLADNDIRTAYIGQEVNEEFDGYNPILRYLSYVEFDPKDESVIFPYGRKSATATWILITAQSLTNGLGQASLPDIYASTESPNFKFFVSDNYSEGSDECLEANVYYVIGDSYDDFMPPSLMSVDYYAELTDNYFAPYRIEWFMDEYDDELAELVQATIENGTMEKAQQIYGVVLNHLSTYSTRMVLERGAFILLEEPYCVALDDCGKSNAQNYLAYAIHKYLQNPTEYDSNNEVGYDINDYEWSLCVQLNALKKYFSERAGFEWIEEVPSEHSEFMPTLQRLAKELGNDYQESPMDELAQSVKNWVRDPQNNELFKY